MNNVWVLNAHCLINWNMLKINDVKIKTTHACFEKNPATCIIDQNELCIREI